MNRFQKFLVILGILIAIPALYTLRDMRLARNMAIHASHEAVPGKLLDEYLSAFPREDYRVIRSGNECILVPRRGMGRYHCTIYLNGRLITGSSTGLQD